MMGTKFGRLRPWSTVQGKTWCRRPTLTVTSIAPSTSPLCVSSCSPVMPVVDGQRSIRDTIVSFTYTRKPGYSARLPRVPSSSCYLMASTRKPCLVTEPSIRKRTLPTVVVINGLVYPLRYAPVKVASTVPFPSMISM